MSYSKWIVDCGIKNYVFIFYQSSYSELCLEFLKKDSSFKYKIKYSFHDGLCINNFCKN